MPAMAGSLLVLHAILLRLEKELGGALTPELRAKAKEQTTIPATTKKRFLFFKETVPERISIALLAVQTLDRMKAMAELARRARS